MENHQENLAKKRDKDPQESNESRSSRNNIPAERKEHVCSECHPFISGKALGGHLSAHVQAKKTKNKSGVKGGEMQEDDDQINTCLLCDKQFPSKKSLYGHLRSHPDRAWRGVEPPPLPVAEAGLQPEEIQEEEEAESAKRAVVDLQGCLKHWGATDKRGRIKQMHYDVPLHQLLALVDEEDSCIRNGDFGSMKINEKKNINGDFASSRSLMMEKGKGKVHVSEGPRFGQVERSSSCGSEDTDEYYCKDHLEEIRMHGGILMPKKIVKKKTISELESKQEQEMVSSYENKESSESEHEPEPKPTSKKKRALELETAEQDWNNRCKCSTCGKGLNCFQALGGHNAMHHKFKIEIHNTIDHQCTATTATIGGGATVGQAATSSKGATGQPPGVHRRVGSRQQAASREIPEAAGIRKLLVVDLNEMPDTTNERYGTYS